MSEGNQLEIDVIESPTFRKVMKKLSNREQDVVDDQIDLIIETPEIGDLKKGDLSYLRVHKFKLNKQQVLLGYSWNEDELLIHLLNLGSHENFYRDVKRK